MSDTPVSTGKLGERPLKKPLNVLDIWSLGVGAVITGTYFGWNLSLRDHNGPMAVLVASLIVCLLYLMWVLALSELSVAMPFAGGPLAYGRRAMGPAMGFVMGWSMFLECQFATIATALATGSYVASLFPEAASDAVEVGSALATVVVFFALHSQGVKEQSRVMVLMTYGAILGLVIFWCLAATDFRWERIWTDPVLPTEKGWRAVLDAIPYCLWWLVIIETVALAAEEADEPHRTIPRGLVWAQLTLIVLVVLTWLFACGAVDDSVRLAKRPDGTDEGAPLAAVIGMIPIGQSKLAAYSFGLIAIFGMIASYHGMVYGTSRQAFALGRSGYLPRVLGLVHTDRRTPIPALALCSIVTVGFIVANIWFKDAIALAVLVSTLTALIWYILAIVCLLVLRRREPQLFRHYRAPLARVLPAAVVLLSALAVWVYSGIDVNVVPLTVGLYALGLFYFAFWSRSRIRADAPEEDSARSPTAQA